MRQFVAMTMLPCGGRSGPGPRAGRGERGAGGARRPAVSG